LASSVLFVPPAADRTAFSDSGIGTIRVLAQHCLTGVVDGVIHDNLSSCPGSPGCGHECPNRKSHKALRVYLRSEGAAC
jgi:hypothetical protein